MVMMMKRLSALALTLALWVTLAVPAFAAKAVFADVPSTYWAYAEIEEAYADGVINGTSVSGSVRYFSPENTLTLAHFTAIMCRAFYADEVATSSATGTWYAKEEAVARQHGLLNGLSLTASNAASRYEMAQFLTNLLTDQGLAELTSSQISAVSAQITDWNVIPAQLQTAVATVYDYGIIQGDSAGRFNGSSSLKRSHSSAIYIRTKNVIETGGGDSSSEAVLANGKPMTEDNIREIIYALKSSYPEGMPWTNANSYTSTTYYPQTYYVGAGCFGFGLICSDAVFGDLPVTDKYTSFDSIRVGDLVRTNKDTHTVVVLEKRTNSIVVVEGNYNNSIHWGREITRQSLEDGNFYGETRYPA